MEGHCTAGEEGHWIVVAEEGIVDRIAVVEEGHLGLGIAGHVEVVDTAFQYPAGLVDSKSRQLRRVEVERTTSC